MAITQNHVTEFLDEIGLKYQTKDEETVLFPYSDDDINEKILVAVSVLENGEYLRMRTVKHLDDLVAETDAEKRHALLEWMLYQNYRSKLGAWEYDPTDHDHHLAVSMPIEDGSASKKQMMRMLAVMIKSVELIPEMKKLLGIETANDDSDDTAKKRAELLAQLRELDGQSGI
jgi:ribulose 1,5-bisphosphate synthetase/thiazole synthase